MASPLLVILSPPRSFSSVVGAMLGQHPEMYGLPETNLFTADSVAKLQAGYRLVGEQARHGLLRVLAQLHDGRQTEVSVNNAQAWLDNHRAWPTKAVLDHIIELAASRIIVEKSPRVTRQPRHLERIYSMYPEASFLHLTRHPRGNALSQVKITSRNREWGGRLDASKIKPQNWWWHCHKNIIEFIAGLPVGQSMRIKGEDLLSEPDVYLPQIAEWLGVRVDSAALEAMKHPERSAYACLGPANAKYGNDINFMEKPHLRSGRIVEGSLGGALEWAPDQCFSPEVVQLARQFGYR